MHHFWKKVEEINHKLLFPAILILLVIIYFELFVHTENEQLKLGIHVADYLVIAIFVLDLIFLAIHAKSTKFFFRNYWLDLLAVFPFGIMFGFLEGVSALFRASEEVAVGQAMFHETLEASKAAARAERFAKIGKELKVGVRVLRVVSKSRLFTRFQRRKVENVRV